MPRAAPPTSAPLSDADRDRRLRVLAPAFTDRVVVWVDHREIRPTSAEYLAPRPRTTADDLSPLGAYRLRGRMPIDARTMQWYYGLVIDPYPMVVHRADARRVAETVLGNAWSRQLDLSGQFHAPTQLQTAREYAALGYAVVLPQGFEHMLFVLGIVLLSVALRPILAQLGAFTVAASLALGAATYGAMSLSPRIVEPMIALSIAYVAIENIVARDVTPWRLAILFVFGLLHGMKFARVLAVEGSPPTGLLTALASFNVGIAGGLMTVAALAALFVISYRQRAWYHQRIVVPVSLAIAGVGVYWTIARTIG
jgi:hypothetical protein